MLIVLEGIDGSGKETQTKLLSEYLDSLSIQNIVYSFPSYKVTEASRLVSLYLAGEFGDLKSIPAEFAAILYSLDRFEMSNKIKASLAENKVVIADRYVSSNYAHQAAKLPNDKKDEFISWVSDLEYNRLGIPKPDKILFLNTHPKITSQLINMRNENITTPIDLQKVDIHEKDSSYQQLVYDEYLRIAKNESWNVIDCFSEIDCTPTLLSKEDIALNVKNALRGLF